MTPPDAVREEAKELAISYKKSGYKEFALHEYTDRSGAPAFWKLRAKNPESGDKTFCLFSYVDGRVEKRKPQIEGGDLLYDLKPLKERPSDRVWVVEGEQCVDELAKLGWLAVTSGGADSAAKADWSPLRGRAVAIWADNDEKGRSYGNKVEEALRSLGCDVDRVDVAALNLPPKGDCCDWIKGIPQGTVIEASMIPLAPRVPVSPEPSEATTEKKPNLSVIDLYDLLARELKPKEKILPWMPTQSLCMVHAWRGVGKTHFALGVAHAVASGSSFLGWEAVKERRVLYVDGEMPAIAIKDRLKAIVESTETKAAAQMLKVITPDLQDKGLPDLATDEGQEALNEVVGDSEVIIIDNLSCLVRGTGKENDAESWVKVQEWALRHRSAGRSILFVHHSGKSGNQRGTSKKEDVLDTVICLKHSEDYSPTDGAVFEVHFEKARHCFGAELAPFVARLETTEEKQVWVTKLLEDSTFEKVVKLSKEGVSQKDIAEQLGVHKSTVSRHIKQAQLKGDLPKRPRKAAAELEEDEQDEEQDF